MQGGPDTRRSCARQAGPTATGLHYPGIFMALCVVLNYVAPTGVIELLMSLIVAALVITWVTIIVAHLRFRRAADAGKTQPRFLAPFTPLSNYLCLAAMTLVVGVMLLTPSIRGSALAIPVWVGWCMGCIGWCRWRVVGRWWELSGGLIDDQVMRPPSHPIKPMSAKSDALAIIKLDAVMPISNEPPPRS